MVKETAEFAHHNADQAIQDRAVGLDWVQELREQQQMLQAQCEFLIRQAEIVLAQSKALAQNGAHDVSELEAVASRKRSEAA